ncbi:MAG: DoxX family protein [Pseudomonadales bacterium]
MFNPQQNDDIGKLILRLTVGAMMIFHGVAKLGDGGALNWIGRQVADLGLPSVVAYGVYVGEIVAPLMVIAGVYCRIGAGLMVVNMLFAVGLVHMVEVLTLNEHGGYALELHAFYTFVAVALIFMGSGRFAVRPD